MTKKGLSSFSSSEDIVSHSTPIKNMYMYFIVIPFLLKSPKFHMTAKGHLSSLHRLTDADQTEANVLFSS